MDAPRGVGADGLLTRVDGLDDGADSMGGTGEFNLAPAPAPGRGLRPAFRATRPNGSGKLGHPLPPLPPTKTPDDVPFSVVLPLTTSASSAPPPHGPKMSARSGRMPQHPPPFVGMAVPSPPESAAWGFRLWPLRSIRRFRPPSMAREVPSVLTTAAVAMVLVGLLVLVLLGEVEVEVEGAGVRRGRGGERRGSRPLGSGA
mmetsp:Transcript_21692/g.51230  ORF Transcript_21692/g.51230 Transcript_21692/m.51230 type:complete len:201 (-) Transcript_21692:193-795(-)